ncbi:MAG: sugar transferase [Polyangiaceae bacterium]
MPIPYEKAKRALDFGVSLGALTALSVPLVAIAAAIRATSKGPAIHWSRRVGKDNREFKMPKFRTMRTDTPQVATHLMQRSFAVRDTRREIPSQDEPGRTAATL